MLSTSLKLSRIFFLACVLTALLPGVSIATEKADLVMVDKSKRQLHLLKKGEIFATFPVTFGADTKGHKQQRGDGRTPEGRYTLDWKNSNSGYYKSIHISYPDAADKAAAAKAGRDPGDNIMLHGQKNGYEWLESLARFVNWTDGCIALSNSDMDKVWDKIDPGTPIEIRP